MPSTCMRRVCTVRHLTGSPFSLSASLSTAASVATQADHPAFIASTVGSGTCSSPPFPQRDTRTWKSDVLHQEQQHHSRLRPRCRGCEHPPTFSTPRRRRRQTTTTVVASSSGLQEPLERVTAGSTTTQHSEGAARQAWSLRKQQQQQQQRQQPAAVVAADEREQARRPGRTARDSYGSGSVAAAAGNAGDGSNARSIYGAQGEGSEGATAGRPGYGDAASAPSSTSAQAAAKEQANHQAAAVDYGFEFEDEEDVDIYLPGGMGAGLRPGFKPRKSKPPAKWSKAVRGSSRFRVVLAGREDLDEAGALCIKVFFGQPDSPWKAAQLRQLTKEQGQDLESRCNRKESVMFKAIDARSVCVRVRVREGVRRRAVARVEWFGWRERFTSDDAREKLRRRCTL